jgi:hypothetical protein
MMGPSILTMENLPWMDPIHAHSLTSAHHFHYHQTQCMVGAQTYESSLHGWCLILFACLLQMCWTPLKQFHHGESHFENDAMGPLNPYGD